jgi:hypothetical protein
MKLEELCFDDRGLIPVVVQDVGKRSGRRGRPPAIPSRWWR